VGRPFRLPTPEEATRGNRPDWHDPVPDLENAPKTAEQIAAEEEHLRAMQRRGFAGGRPSNRALSERRR
jgi:hypothetical protein